MIPVHPRRGSFGILRRMVGGLEDDRIPIIAVSERGRGGLQQLSFDPHADYGPLSGFRSLSGGAVWWWKTKCGSALARARM